MRKVFRVTICILLAMGLTASSAVLAKLSDSPTTLEVGKWKVLRSVDTMTDEVSCTGVHGTGYGIQLSEDALFVTVRGGIEGYRVRFDDEPVSGMKLPSDLEKKVDAIQLAKKSFDKVLESRRLRMKVLTLVRGIQTEDLDLTGIREAHAHILAGCPMPEGGPVEMAAEVSGEDGESSRCSAEAMSVLRRHEVDAAVIEEACGG